MAKKAAKKKSGTSASKKASSKVSGKKTAKKASARGRGLGYKRGMASGKHLVIVESPSKAKTINKYLGDDYLVLASVGHVRDLPSKNPKGEKSPVPGVNLEKRFTPKYEVLSGKEQVVKDLKSAAKDAEDVWFATDLDREGEAIAWHLAAEMGIDIPSAKRVMFAAITKAEIGRAFANPHRIDEDRVNAQQARRILDRIVGYQVSPLLWKKVAQGLSAGRVQSVAVRLVVDREREIRAFIPDEYWQLSGIFALREDKARELGPAWEEFLQSTDAKGQAPTIKKQNEWLASQPGVRAELVEVGGKKFDLRTAGGDGSGFESASDHDASERVRTIAAAAGLKDLSIDVREDERGKGPARWRRTVSGMVDPATPYAIDRIETKRTKTRPGAPFITSTLQQAASSRLGFAASRTMRTAQALYEGVDVPGEGPTGLITYMRTDSTHLTPEAVQSCRNHIKQQYGDTYLPEKPNFYSSSNKAAQEAHEAIRPTSLAYPPNKVKSALSADQLKLYTLIWERFVSCQMVPAEWDSTSVTIVGGADPALPLTFRATGRTLAFDGFYRCSGVPTASDQATLPPLEEEQPMRPFSMDAEQKFTSPPSRFTEASLIKVLESEGIGRPSTYADIIAKIQQRKYVEQINRAFYATDLGEVVVDKLIEAFPEIMDVGYTREMEGMLDKIEEEHFDWVRMLEEFYGPFKDRLEHALEAMQHAKAEIVPAPEEYRCGKCEASLVYRFGRNGRFLSCSRYPDCNYACPCDREGRPQEAEFVNVKCPKTGRPMVRRNGRFGPFLTTALEEGEKQDVGMILNIDKKGFVTAPSIPPLETDRPCPTCESPLNLRGGVRGPWLGCSRFPKCRGRGKWTELEDAEKAALEEALEAHERANPVPIIETFDGKALTDAKGKPLPEAPKAEELILQGDPRKAETAAGVG